MYNDIGILSIYTFVMSSRNDRRVMRRVVLDRRWGIDKDQAMNYLDRFKEDNPELKFEARYTTEIIFDMN